MDFGATSVPQLASFNLFSVSHSFSHGFNLRNKKEKLLIKKDHVKLMFGKQTETESGYVVGTKIVPLCDSAELAGPTLPELHPANMNDFHKLLAHPSESKMRFIAKYYTVKLTGKVKVCTHGVKAKARQANIPKDVPDENKTDGSSFEKTKVEYLLLVRMVMTNILHLERTRTTYATDSIYWTKIF